MLGNDGLCLPSGQITKVTHRPRELEPLRSFGARNEGQRGMAGLQIGGTLRFNLAYWQPENANVAAEVFAPAVTVSGVLVVVELVCRSEGLQSGVLVPSVVKARASSVYVTAPAAGGAGF